MSPLGPAKEVREETQRLLGFTGRNIDGDFGEKTHARYNTLSDLDVAPPALLAIDSILGLGSSPTRPVRLARFRELDDFPDSQLWPPSGFPAEKPLAPPASGDFDTRASSALHPPLNSVERAATFGGPFQWRRKPVAGNAENIVILGDWEAENIVRVEVPQLLKIPGNFSRMALNKRVAKQTLALWAAWEKAGLLHLILSYEGAFVARLIRGSTSSLSNHAYGSAFDINYFWNQLGRTPARAGSKGSVRELVALAHKHGFFWGGNFARLDGMHFEICRIL